MTTKKRSKITSASIRRFVTNPRFQRFYFFGSIVILGATTIFWSLIGSFIQAGNADQLANSYQLESGTAFGGAVLPDQHSFLFKLPFFWLVQLLGGSPAAFSFVTVLVVFLTVGLFAFILYKLRPNRLIAGTLFMGLALVLTMVPAEPYSNSLLPASMAMLTTRNLEYILFIAIVLLVVRARKWVSGQLLLALVLMILLVTSDKLFLSIGIGGAILFLILAFLRKKPELRTTAFRWIVVSVLGSFGALLLLHFVTAFGILHLDGHNIASPYEVIHSFKDGLIAVFYAIAGIFTNFGANPGFDSRTIIDFVGFATPRLSSILSYVYVATLTIATISIVAAFLQVKKVIQRKPRRKFEFTPVFIVSLLLIMTSVAALGAFVVSSHYYPVDSRYLTIVLFTGFITLAAFPFKKQLPVIRLVVVGAILFIVLIPALLFPVHNLQSYQTASNDLTARNKLVAQTLALHHADTLIGNYWRVFPIKLLSTQEQTVSPLNDCTEYRDVLGSKAWQLDLKQHSFAYLLTLSDETLNFPNCSLSKITAVYGRPDSSVVISGTTKDPKEVLLFYDQGIHKTRSVNIENRAPDTVLPITLDAVPFRDCGDNNKTIMNVVAHEDDDILFMNPDLYHDIQAGSCIRSVFVTAGDAGSDAPYWLGRQKGTQAAYALMLGRPEIAWTERVVEISPDHFATIANPRGNRKISLIFLHLPDGNMNGRGFAGSNNQSLSRLLSNQAPKLSTVDKQSTYTSVELQNALLQLIKAYLPDTIRAQSIAASGGKYDDHSDHTAVGQYVARTTAAYIASGPTIVPGVTYYLGYPVRNFAENVSSAELDMKTKIFLEFGRFDGATCHSAVECDHTAYGPYLHRQYTSPN